MLLHRLSLLNFDLNGAAELPVGSYGEEGLARRDEGALREKSTPCWRGPAVG